MGRRGVSLGTVAGLAMIGVFLVAGLVYITSSERAGTPTATIIEVSTRSVTLDSSGDPTANTTVTSFITTTVTPTNVSASTVTTYVTTVQTSTSTAIVPSGTKTVTVSSTATVSGTVTQTVTTTVDSSGSTSTAPFTATVVSCLSHDSSDEGDASCEIMLKDSGAPQAEATGCTLQLNGAGVPGSLASTDGGNRTSIVIPQNGTPIYAWCTGTSPGGSAGSEAYGTIALSNLESLQFIGSWQ